MRPLTRFALVCCLIMGGVVTSVAATSDVASAGGSASVTLYVTTSGSGSICSATSPCGTIQTAIDTATGGTYAGEYVTIDVATGTYNETDTIDSSSLAGLTITGAGAGSTEIDGDDSGSVVAVSNGTVNISDLTITGGNASEHGGGIANGGTVTLMDTTLMGNNGSNYGGAIWNSGFLTVIDSDLNNNTASYGGAIYNSAFVNINTSTLSHNSAGQGGGALYSISDATVSDSTVSGNTTSADGGGLFEANNSLSVTDSTLSGNTATDYGGGIESDEATITVDNSTVSDNTASTDDGGGIDIEDVENSGSSTIENSTVVGNSAPSYYGGGIQDEQSPLTIGATIVAGSTSGNDCFIQAATVTDLGYNLDNDGTCHFNGTGDLADNSSADLDPSGLADNNGPTQTVALEAGSSAIGAVTDGSLCPATDQRGAPRTTPCDIGAYDTNVSGPFSDVVALGSQTWGSSATVTSVQYPGAGDSLGGTLTCSTVDGGTSISPTLAVGSHTVDGSSCSGVTSSLSNPVYYQGVPSGLVVSQDTTSTNIATSMASQPSGNESATTFTVTVATGNGEELPATETATVDVGTTSCVATITPEAGGASGGCSIGNSALPVGSYTAVADYGGDSDLNGSTGAPTPFTVTTAATIDGVTFGGTPSNPTMTVSGSGFDAESDLGTAYPAACSASGSDYGSNITFSDNTSAWEAGLGTGGGGDCIGLIISSYSNTQITYTFGNGYIEYAGPINDGDSFTMSVLGATFNGTAELGTGYTCTVSGDSTTTSFPVVMSESPAPPSTIDAGGTFSTALAAQVTVPASVINHFIGTGATSLTVASQTSAEDGLTSVGGSASGAVDPNTESATADNLPQSDTTLVADTPYTYDTAYNPVTWQTGPGTGTVYFVPGSIDAELTFVVHNNPTSESLACNPPSGVAALGSTTVKAPPPTPTFQVPSSTPPLQNQVSAGTDGGWAATVTNTSTASVDGLTATVSVSDGGHPLTYDLAAMSASGTSCSADGSGKVTCSIGTLTKGASDTLNLLVDTTGLANGTTITGSASVTSSHAGTHATTLSGVGVVVVESGNGTEAVAAPGIPLASTKRTLKQAKAKVTLTLPKAKIKVTKKPDSRAVTDGSITPLLAPFAATTVTENPPPVAVTLKSLAPSAEPALCPPTGSTKCEGNIVEAYGNFGVYTSNLAPIQAVVQFFYGTTIPSGTVYFLKPNGKTVDKLAACKKTSAGYDTPCLANAEKDLGTTGNKYAQDTVYFTGNDPIMGRR